MSVASGLCQGECVEDASQLTGRGLKTLFTRAVTRELNRFAHAARDGQAVWPFITSGRKGTVRLTNDDLARIDAGEDEARAGRATRRR